MQKVNLEVLTRDMQSEDKKNPNQLRRDGLVPGVIYGHGEPVAVLVNAKEFGSALKNKAGANALFTVKVGSESNLTVIKEIQRDIFSRAPIHIDFQRINAKEKLEVTVGIHLNGESTGVKNEHGVLQFITREVRVKCLPDDIPASIDVDITNLGLHHSIKVKDLQVPQGVEVVTAADHIVVTIVTAKVEEEAPKPAAGAEATAAQPEVIAKGKKDEEGAEGAAAAPAAAEGAKKK